MADRFSAEGSILSSADEAIPVSAGEDFAPGKAVYVGTGGDLVAKTMSGQVRTWKNVPSGTELNVRLTGLDATCVADDILIYY